MDISLNLLGFAFGEVHICFWVFHINSLCLNTDFFCVFNKSWHFGEGMGLLPVRIQIHIWVLQAFELDVSKYENSVNTCSFVCHCILLYWFFFFFPPEKLQACLFVLIRRLARSPGPLQENLWGMCTIGCYRLWSGSKFSCT